MPISKSSDQLFEIIRKMYELQKIEKRKKLKKRGMYTEKSGLYLNQGLRKSCSPPNVAKRQTDGPL